MNNKRVVKFCKEFYFVNKPHLSPRHARYSNKQVTILYPKRTIFFFLVLFSVKLNTSMFYKRQKDHIISCRLSRAVANQAQLSKLNLFNVSLFQRSANKLRQIWPFTWLLNSILKKIAPQLRGAEGLPRWKLIFFLNEQTLFFTTDSNCSLILYLRSLIYQSATSVLFICWINWESLIMAGISILFVSYPSLYISLWCFNSKYSVTARLFLLAICFIHIN